MWHWQHRCLAGASPVEAVSEVRARRYARSSEQAHGVLGFALGLTILIWGYHVVGQASSLPHRSSRWAGITAICAGCYLLAWVFWLVSPRPAANFDLAHRDLIQTQHIAISLNLLAAGVAELRAEHRLWLANVAAIALVFLGHPQRTPLATTQHSIIGYSLLIGAYLLAQEKERGFPHHSLDAPLAACFVGLSCLVLLAYQEPAEDGYHRPFPLDICQPGADAALFGVTTACFTFTNAASRAVLTAVCDNRRLSMMRRQHWPQVTAYARVAPADDLVA